MEETIGVWEGEGGATRSMPVSVKRPLTGTSNRVEWAVQIRARVNAEFDRVAQALEAAAKKRPDHRRANIQAAILILEDKRAEVMAKVEAPFQSSVGRVSVCSDTILDSVEQDKGRESSDAQPVLQNLPPAVLASTR